jgi:cell division protein FtsW (lipid II flippase)
LLLPFGVLSLAIVVAGIFISASNGVPASVWARNGIAWIAGALAAAGLSALKRRDVLQVALWAAPVGLAASLLSPGVQDVHRWVNLGPLQLNVAMLLAPAAVVALAVLCRAGASAWVAGLAALVLLVIQPDASQATTLAAVAVLVALAALPKAPVRIAVVGVAAALAGMAWLRPDPLEPVAEVEGIFGLALALSPWLAAAAGLLLAGVAGLPVLWGFRGSPTERLAGAALGLCLLLWAVMPFLGAFPAPLLGLGMSPIIGAWLGVGLLAGLRGNG